MSNNLKKDQSVENPCWEESMLSLRCLDQNNYDKDICDPYFENYKMCKRFWSFVKRQRRLEGHYPLIPLPEDREKVKEEYMARFAKEKPAIHFGSHM